MEGVILPPAYFASVGMYAVMAKYGACALIDYSMPASRKRKEAHRCVILSNPGHNISSQPSELEMLTAAVCAFHTGYSWRDVRLSAHGNWWEKHLTSLATAYGASPFFEFYIDRFAEVLSVKGLEEYPTVTALDRKLDSLIRSILRIPPQPRDLAVFPAGLADLRNHDFSTVEMPDWYHSKPKPDTIRPAQLSVLDLIFNLGPEASLYLRKI